LRNINGARYSQIPLDYDDLYGGIRNAQDAADNAQSSHSEGRYQEAMDAARGVRAQLSDINDRIASAATAGKK
jgi:hypothetical protein